MPEAQAAAERAAALAPTEPWAWECLARVLRGRGRLTEALAALDNVDSRDPTAAEALELRGHLLEDLGRDDEAAEVFAVAFDLMAAAQDLEDEEDGCGDEGDES